jgi:hypothetical protein
MCKPDLSVFLSTDFLELSLVFNRFGQFRLTGIGMLNKSNGLKSVKTHQKCVSFAITGPDKFPPLSTTDKVIRLRASGFHIHFIYRARVTTARSRHVYP